MKTKHRKAAACGKKVLMAVSVASMIDQFNLPNILLLQKLGYEVHVACNFKQGNTCHDAHIQKLQRELKKMHVVQHQWDCPRSVCPVMACVKAYRQIFRLMALHAFAWVHCQSPVGGALARIAAHRQRIRVLYTAHGFHFYKGAPLKNWIFYYPAEKMLAPWTDVLVTINKEDEWFARRHLHAGKICRIPGVGIDICRFQKKASKEERKKFRQTYGVPEDACILLSVGELSRRKNQRIVLQALSGLKEKNIYYFICGQGPLQKKLLQEAEKGGLQDRVKMLGFVEDAAFFYRNADIFVFPSMQEGMPVALMEAMASGLPCLVSDIRGNRELIGRQFRFPPAGQQELRKLLEMFLENKRIRRKQGQLNEGRIIGFASSSVQKQMLKIYRYYGNNGNRSEYRRSYKNGDGM